MRGDQGVQTPRARLRVFGGLALIDPATGAPVGAPRRKPLAVLAVLAVAGPTGMDRNVLASLLWSDLDDARARRALAQSLYALRRELPGDEIVEGGSLLVLRAAAVPSDAMEFEALLSDNAGAHSADLIRGLTRCYTGAFLDGVYFTGSASFDQWVEATRARYERRFVQAVYDSVREQAATGEILSALETALGRAPHSTQLALLLARLLASVGRPTEALSVLVEHTAAVLQLTGVEPPDEVRHVAEAIRSSCISADLSLTVPKSEDLPVPADPTPRLERTGPAQPAFTRRRHWALRPALAVMVSTSILGVAAYLLRPGSSQANPLPSNEVLEQLKRIRGGRSSMEGDASHTGRIIIFSPSAGGPALQKLAPQITAEFYREITREVPDVVDSATVERLERDAEQLKQKKATRAEYYGSMMLAAQAAMGIRVTYQQQGDSLFMFTEKYFFSSSARYARSFRPFGTSTTNLGVVQGMSGLDGSQVRGLLSSFALMNRRAASNLRIELATMSSCRIEDHVDENSAGMCWIGKNSIFSFWVDAFWYRLNRKLTLERAQHVYDSLIKAGRHPAGADSLLYRQLNDVSRLKWVKSRAP